MKSENISCPKCRSKEQGNAFCSKCGNNLIVNTHKEEPKNQKEDIPKPVIEESSEIEQQQFNSLMGIENKEEANNDKRNEETSNNIKTYQDVLSKKNGCYSAKGCGLLIILSVLWALIVGLIIWFCVANDIPGSMPMLSGIMISVAAVIGGNWVSIAKFLDK